MDQRIFELDAFADGKQGRVVSVATAEGGVGGFAGINKRGIGDDFCHCAAPFCSGTASHHLQLIGWRLRAGLQDRGKRNPADPKVSHT